MEAIDWSKAPEGATHFDPLDSNWLRERPGTVDVWHRGTGWNDPQGQYPRQIYEISTPLMIRPAPAWTGEGLPPVGTVCEFNVDDDEWRECEVIAHKDGYAVCWIHVNKVFTTSGTAVRPIRTPEQIEAEARSQAVFEMIRIWNVPPTGSAFNYAHDLAEMLYDAGYRKQGAPK